MKNYQFVTLTVLLILIIGMMGFQVYSSLLPKSSPLSADCTSALVKANAIISTQQNMLTSQLSDYETAVYKTKSTDTIQKQTFLANEFEFNTLNLIALQNAALLDITTNCK